VPAARERDRRRRVRPGLRQGREPRRQPDACGRCAELGHAQPRLDHHAEPRIRTSTPRELGHRPRAHAARALGRRRSRYRRLRRPHPLHRGGGRVAARRFPRRFRQHRLRLRARHRPQSCRARGARGPALVERELHGVPGALGRMALPDRRLPRAAPLAGSPRSERLVPGRHRVLRHGPLERTRRFRPGRRNRQADRRALAGGNRPRHSLRGSGDPSLYLRAAYFF
jgi:hypothetical protein